MKYDAVCKCEWKYLVYENQKVTCLKCGEVITHEPLTSKPDTGAKLACGDGLYAKCSEGKQKDINFLIEMSETLKEGLHRRDQVRLDHVQKMIDDWLDELHGA